MGDLNDLSIDSTNSAIHSIRSTESLHSRGDPSDCPRGEFLVFFIGLIVDKSWAPHHSRKTKLFQLPLRVSDAVG